MDQVSGQSSSEPSMDDMIAALDAVEAAEGGEGSEQEPPENEGEQGEEGEGEVEQPKFTVTVGGKSYEVTQDELVQGYQRTADYTRKSQEQAEAKRLFEKEVEGVRAKATETSKQHEAVIGRLAQAERFLQANLGQPPGPGLAHSDAQQYLVLKAAYDERLSKLQNVHNALENEKRTKQESEQQSATEELDKVWARLTATVPGWSDPKKAATGTDALIGYVTGLGMSREQLSKQTSFAFWDLALKAQQFDKLQGMRAELKNKKDRPSPTARPGAATPANAVDSQRQQKLVGNWQKTRSLKDAMAAAETMKF